MPSGSTTRAWPASGRPIRPQGRTTSTSAIIRNTSTSVIFGKIEDAEGLQLPDQQRRQERAGHRAHAAHHRDDEGLGDHRDVHVRVGGKLGRLQRAAEPGQRRAEEQRAGEQQRLVDAQRAHHLAVLRGGAHQHAEAGLVHQQPQQAQHQRAHDDQEQLVGGKAMAEDVDGMPQPRRARPQDVERPPHLEHQVLHGEDHAEGGEQLEQLGHAIDAPQQHQLHQHADQPDAERGQQDGRRGTWESCWRRRAGGGSA